MPQPALSLLRYENPILVSRVDNKSKSNQGSKSPERVATKLPPVDEKGAGKAAAGASQTEDILSAILPPR